jgi:hypothetical protein
VGKRGVVQVKDLLGTKTRDETTRREGERGRMFYLPKTPSVSA